MTAVAVVAEEDVEVMRRHFDDREHARAALLRAGISTTAPPASIAARLLGAWAGEWPPGYGADQRTARASLSTGTQAPHGAPRSARP